MNGQTALLFALAISALFISLSALVIANRLPTRPGSARIRQWLDEHLVECAQCRRLVYRSRCHEVVTIQEMDGCENSYETLFCFEHAPGYDKVVHLYDGGLEYLKKVAEHWEVVERRPAPPPPGAAGPFHLKTPPGCPAVPPTAPVRFKLPTAGAGKKKARRRKKAAKK